MSMCVCTSVCCGQCSHSVHDPKAAHELVVLVFTLIYHLRAKRIFFSDLHFIQWELYTEPKEQLS